MQEQPASPAAPRPSWKPAFTERRARPGGRGPGPAGLLPAAQWAGGRGSTHSSSKPHQLRRRSDPAEARGAHPKPWLPLRNDSGDTRPAPRGRCEVTGVSAVSRTAGDPVTGSSFNAMLRLKRKSKRRVSQRHGLLQVGGSFGKSFLSRDSGVRWDGAPVWETLLELFSFVMLTRGHERKIPHLAGK